MAKVSKEKTGVTKEESRKLISADARLSFSIDEFGAIFGISRSAVYSLIRTGEVKPARILGRTVLTKGEVARFGASLEAQVASGSGAEA